MCVGVSNLTEFFIWQPAGAQDPLEGASEILSSEGIHRTVRREPVANDNAQIALQTGSNIHEDERPRVIARHKVMLSTRNSKRLPWLSSRLKACLNEIHKARPSERVMNSDFSNREA